MAFSDTDKGLRALLKRLDTSKPVVLTVGIHGEDGDQIHESPEGAAPSKLTVAQIATVHEYGLGHVPQRSFIRAWADEKQAQHQADLKTIMENVAKGNYTLEVGLERLGSKFKAEIQERISNNIPPPLDPATIARKKSSVALVNTGQLKSSIDYKVGNGSDSE